MSSRREPPRRHREWKPERALRRQRVDWRQVAFVIAIAAALGLALAIVLVAAFVPPVRAEIAERPISEWSGTTNS